MKAPVRCSPGIATAADLVDRQFTHTEPDQLWVTDMPPQAGGAPSEHRTREVKISCCVALDAWSLRVVGWSIDSAAPTVAWRPRTRHGHRQPRPRCRRRDPLRPWVQFISWACTDRGERSGLLSSMRSVGNADDSAVIESLWGCMQTELLDRHRWKTRTELVNAIFDHLEVLYNRRRRHCALGMLTPIEFELRYPPGAVPLAVA